MLGKPLLRPCKCFGMPLLWCKGCSMFPAWQSQYSLSQWDTWKQSLDENGQYWLPVNVRRIQIWSVPGQGRSMLASGPQTVACAVPWQNLGFLGLCELARFLTSECQGLINYTPFEWALASLAARLLPHPPAEGETPIPSSFLTCQEFFGMSISCLLDVCIKQMWRLKVWIPCDSLVVTQTRRRLITCTQILRLHPLE